jgi:hypothetical protein
VGADGYVRGLTGFPEIVRAGVSENAQEVTVQKQRRMFDSA